MKDFILTSELIQQQEKKTDLFKHIEINFFKELMLISEKVDCIIMRLQKLLKASEKNKHYLFFGKKIRDEYHVAKREWNTYIDKMYIILKKVADGNVLLEKDAVKFYQELSL